MTPLIYLLRERREKLMVGEWRRLKLVVVFCVYVVFCVVLAVRYFFTHFVTTPGDILPQFLSMVLCSNAPPEHR